MVLSLREPTITQKGKTMKTITFFYQNRDSVDFSFNHMEDLIAEAKKYDIEISPLSKIGNYVKLHHGLTIPANTVISSCSEIFSGVILAESVTIHHNVIISKDSKIGRNSSIGSNTRVERNCNIKNTVRIGVNMLIGANTTIESGSTISCRQ